jgi:hypothetical protein
MCFRIVRTGDVSLYIEGNTVRPEMRGRYVAEPAYQIVIDNMIMVCVDAVIINRKQRVFYLAKRVIRPMPGIWWMGGSRKKGYSPLEGICCKFREETGVDLPGDRFTFVTMTEYLWQDREQQPQDKGSHNICHQFAVELTDDELKIIRECLNRGEYDHTFGLQVFDRDRLMIAKVHPVILEVFDKIFP